MRMMKKTMTLALLALAVALGTSAFEPPKKEHKRNLKVLPKNISHDELDKIMHEFNDALGVKCSHCHAGGEVEGKFKLFFASDEKPEKEEAREMLRMTQQLNRKYFHYREGGEEARPAVSCMTCHNGNVHPK